MWQAIGAAILVDLAKEVLGDIGAWFINAPTEQPSSNGSIGGDLYQ